MSSDWRDLGVVVSYVCGIGYFLAWSASFYPQPLLNYRRKSTKGLTADFPLLNVTGFTCYSISTLALLTSRTIRAQYALRHPVSPEPTVRVNDAAFGVHALLLCLVTYSQFYPGLWRWPYIRDVSRRATVTTHGIIAGSILALVIIFLLIRVSNITTGPPSATDWLWLDLIYCLQYIKLLLTFFKYLPQAVANFKRKSTDGWSIRQIQLDTIGGILSLVQLLIDSARQADWSGLTGNPVKLGLANISLAFDVVFMVQHFVLYRPATESKDDSTNHDPERAPLIV